MRLARAAALALLAALALALAACGGSDEPSPDVAATTTTAPAPAKPIRIGTKNFSEQYILGELYSRALRAAGFDVELKRDIGSSEIIHEALRAGGVDMYPEYVGVLLSEIAKRHERPRSSAAAYRLAQDFERRSNFVLLKPTPFSNPNALAVKPAFARRHRVRAIADLRAVHRKVRIGAPAEFRTRYEGLVGLEDRYALRNVRAVPQDGAVRYSALQSGKVDVALVFATDGQLADGRYVVLDDPLRLFATQHVAPIVSRRVMARHGSRLAAVVDAVSRSLTTEAMRRMNKAVDLDRRAAGDVATEFLRMQGLL